LTLDPGPKALEVPVVLDKGHDRRRMLLNPGRERLPPLRQLGDEIAELSDQEGAEEPEEGQQRDDRGQEDGDQCQHPAEPKPVPQPFEVGLADQRCHPGHGQR
jgi:hypothetical protein